MSEWKILFGEKKRMEECGGRTIRRWGEREVRRGGKKELRVIILRRARPIGE